MPDWSRLSKLAGMIGSQNDGERLNAARLLDAALKREGITFGELAKRIADGGSYEPPRTVFVEKRSTPNPAVEMAERIINAAGTKITGSEASFLNGIVRTGKMTGSQFDLSMYQAKWLADLEKIYVLKTMRKATPPARRGPVPKDVLDDLGLGKQAGTFTGNEPRFKRGNAPYRPQARVVDEMPDAREEVETKGNSAWAARKVDLDFDDEVGF